MPCRSIKLVKNEVYHVYNRSIAEFVIFNNDEEYERMVRTIAFCSIERPPCLFKSFLNKPRTTSFQLIKDSNEKRIVEIIAYCLMPTHPHLILKGGSDEDISKFMHRVQNSYSKYFNIKHNRRGPLWEGRFKNVSVKTDEQLLHLTRYIHLNPVTSYLVDKPERWKYSSYGEYTGKTPKPEKICDFLRYVPMTPLSYAKFVVGHIDAQRKQAIASAA